MAIRERLSEILSTGRPIDDSPRAQMARSWLSHREVVSEQSGEGPISLRIAFHQGLELGTQLSCLLGDGEVVEGSYLRSTITDIGPSHEVGIVDEEGNMSIRTLDNISYWRVVSVPKPDVNKE